jgi:hypothetical protein
MHTKRIVGSPGQEICLCLQFSVLISLYSNAKKDMPVLSLASLVLKAAGFVRTV